MCTLKARWTPLRAASLSPCAPQAGAQISRAVGPCSRDLKRCIAPRVASRRRSRQAHLGSCVAPLLLLARRHLRCPPGCRVPEVHSSRLCAGRGVGLCALCVHGVAPASGCCIPSGEGWASARRSSCARPAARTKWCPPPPPRRTRTPPAAGAPARLHKLSLRTPTHWAARPGPAMST